MPPRFDLEDAVGAARARGWPLVMGVLNVTPDSFSDGGRFLNPARAVDEAMAMVAHGADLLDVGGESTRPGSRGVDASEELDRIAPVIQALRERTLVPISVDTSKPEVMHEVARTGADMINDVRALAAPGSLEAAAGTGLPVVLMHMQGEPRSMQHNPTYLDVAAEVGDFLVSRASACEAAGIPRSRIALDPGFGFGKTLDHNLTLLRRLDTLVALGYPVLVGLSRKSMIEKMIGRGVEQRVHASVALALAAAVRGAALVRVHDVSATVDALRVTARVNAMP